MTAFGGREVLGEINHTVLDSQTEATRGDWFDTRGVKTASLEIIDLAVGESIIIHCSNAPGADPPDEDTDGISKQTINGGAAAQFVEITAPYSLWKRFEKTGAVGETTARFAGIK